MRELARRWLSYAETDRLACEQLQHSTGLETVVAFHAQQVIEKSLKAVLVYRGEGPPRIHDLPRLAALVHEQEADVDFDLDMLERITQYYIESRYPVTVEVPPGTLPSADEISSMVSFGTSVLSWARSRIAWT